MNNDTIYIARYVLELVTPLAIGSGKKGLDVDRLVVRDANGLPYIPGTSLAGLLRHQYAGVVDELFGCQLTAKQHEEKAQREGKDKKQVESALGSRVVFSPGLLLSDDGQHVHEGLEDIDFTKEYYSQLQKLPERDHVRITHQGAADARGHGKFNAELVPRGTRFVFEMEMQGRADEQEVWAQLMDLPQQLTFRIGGGTRKGLGEIKIESCLTKTFRLSEPEDLMVYLAKSSSLNGDYSIWDEHTPNILDRRGLVEYRISLTPEDFFFFGAGFGDEDVDDKPKTEHFFDWSSGKAVLQKEHILIPASSVKGAISHRVAFHYNRLCRQSLSTVGDLAKGNLPDFDVAATVSAYLDSLEGESRPSTSTDEAWTDIGNRLSAAALEDILEQDDWQDFIRQLPDSEKTSKESSLPIGENNHAVKALFGYAKDDAEAKDKGRRGSVIFSDVYRPYRNGNDKIFSHVRIDRYTGGALDGALYQEKTTRTDAFTLSLLVEEAALEEPNIKEAFKASLDDLTSGRLQLGGRTTKGHGVFSGNLEVVKS